MRAKDTDKMEKIIEYIDSEFSVNGATPTMQEIGDYMGMSKGNVSDYIKEMVQNGMIESSGGWRGIRTRKMSKSLSDISRVPVVGQIACGTPMFAEENIESYLNISASFLGPGKYFALRAKGDSMINAEIYDGDFVIVKQQQTAEEGQIVVALIDDSTTLKRYYRDDKKRMIRLHPENDDMEDMYFKKVDIQGVVKKVIKDVF